MTPSPRPNSQTSPVSTTAAETPQSGSHLDAEPRSQRQLAVLCRVTDQTMSRTIERLQRNGFVARENDVADRRRTIVRLTAAGRRVLTSARLLKLVRHAGPGR
ncbi:MarR family winged helix-turn-helix transcriptional regulator [Amycolatopsis lurida]